MDEHLREDGVGDLRVPKDMRRLAAAFLGRHRAYIVALKMGDRPALEAALRRNVYADSETAKTAALAAYAEAAMRSLEAQDTAMIADGRVVWPDAT
jgi:cytochrome b pre-mRNA-processing protein 3